MRLAPATVRRLVEQARRARLNAYAPYSRFPVGAAVLTANELVFCGCNVENSSFGLTICAERNAVAAAVVAGQRPVAVVVLTEHGRAAPCGACRQVLAEFSSELTVVLANAAGEVTETYDLGQLLPATFRFPDR